MSTPFLGELKIISWNFAPKGWALCNGQLLPINQNQALFSILGTTFGGDGRVNFALPDLRGRVPQHQGQGFLIGQKVGEEFHTLNLSEMAQHIHFANATSDPHTTSPENYQPVAQDAMFAVVNGLYSGAANLTALLPETLSNTGGSQPFLVLNVIIALQGIFPSRN
jgi:microcystin-dependent protein